MKFQAPRGTQDILPEAAALWQALEERARQVSERHGYREIRTPIAPIRCGSTCISLYPLKRKEC